jgi:hypothetical protein
LTLGQLQLQLQLLYTIIIIITKTEDEKTGKPVSEMSIPDRPSSKSAALGGLCRNVPNPQINDDGFRHMWSLRSLRMRGFLRSEKTSSTSSCLNDFMPEWSWSSPGITNTAFCHLSRLTFLDISECDSTTLSDSMFRHLFSLADLKMRRCCQTTITDEGFRSLSSLSSLDIWGCAQPTISDEAFKHLHSLRRLNYKGCFQATITRHALKPLDKLYVVNDEVVDQTKRGVVSAQLERATFREDANVSWS